MNLIFATNNRHKVDEIKAVLPSHFQLTSLKEAGINIDIPEPHPTLQENAREKAVTIYNITSTICLLLNGNEYFFEGVCKGRIIAESRGSEGFGYDPVFIPNGADKTFAEMSLQEKNRYSHRSKAISRLVLFLNNAE
jgi:XTP/dITP diphosphohydrolase